MSSLFERYTKFYEAKDKIGAFPSEFLVRIFFNQFSNVEGKKVCDISCGDGRNLRLFNILKMETYATEITERIVSDLGRKLLKERLEVSLAVGSNCCIPFDSDSFDYLVSWNACYYMEQDLDFSKHVSEFARVLKPGGKLVLSIPKMDNFIYKNTEVLNEDYVKIKNDYFSGIRNGAVLRRFSDPEDIIKEFSKWFTDFEFGSQEIDDFGVFHNHYIVVCGKMV